MDLKLDNVKVKVNNKLREQKRLYLFLIVVMGLGIIAGLIYALIISKSDHNLVASSLDSFFTNIKESNINYKSGLINSLIGNIFFISFSNL